MTAQNLVPPPIALALALLVILFILCGLIMIPYAGVQTDEAIFASALFDRPYPWFWIPVFGKNIPLMVMSYLGATKAALYAAIFAFWTPSVYSLRIPSLLMGALSLPLCYLFLKRAVGTRPALFATALLSFDTSYLLASVFDWGPVTIQHLCLLGALLLLLKHAQAASMPSLAAGFFLFGLGMWDKAIFAWMLSGTVVAVIAVFPTLLMRELKAKRISAAIFFFALGSLPLIIYNVSQPLATFRGNTVFSTSEVPQKVSVFESTVKGAALRGYLVNDDWMVKQPRQPATAIERAVVGLAEFTGRRLENFQWAALLASLALSPFLLFTQWRRPLAFCLITMAVAWVQMLITQGAGGGTHHVILLWPLPMMLIAIAVESLAVRAGRWGNLLTAAMALLLCIPAFLVTVNYQRQFVRNGAPGAWSDAIFNLANRLEQRNHSAVLLADWGMLDNTRMLKQSRIPLRWASDAITNPNPAEADLKALNHAMDEPGAVFVANTDDRQNFAGVNPNLRKMAERLGYERELLETIPDSLGRPCFEIFRFRRAAPKIESPKPAPVKRRVQQQQPVLK